MIFFLFNKWFWDFWDNMGVMLMFNLGFIVLMAIPLAFAEFIPMPGLLFIPFSIICILALFVYAGAVSMSCNLIARGKNSDWKEFKTFIALSYKKSLLLSVIVIPLAFAATLIMRFYLNLGNIWGIAGASIVFWVLIFLSMSLQFFLPFLAEMNGDRFVKTIKKCFIVLLDNTGAGFFMGIVSIILLILSFFLGLLLPGFTGIILFQNVALRLIMLKYDYQESNPDTIVKGDLWDAALYDEKKRLGKHTLRGMIFPWKE